MNQNLKAYLRGFLAGIATGAAYLTYVYWRAKFFPTDPELNAYYAHLRGLEKNKTPSQRG